MEDKTPPSALPPPVPDEAAADVAAASAAPASEAAIEALGAEGATASPFWRAVREGLGVAGRALAQGALGVGESLAGAYRALDPALVRHMAQLPLVGLTYLTPGMPPLTPLPDDGQRVVVFIHGLGGHRGNFLPMQAYFWVQGRRRALSIGFQERDSIATMADQLAALLRQLIQVNQLAPQRSIELVAHSMGGLIARLMLQDAALAAAVAHLVTLGTPHEGTQLARLLQTTKVRELRSGSEIIARLQGQLPWAGPPALPRLTAVWSPADVVLMPPESARVPGAHNVEVPDFSHFSYLVHPQAWRLAFTLLQDAEGG